METFLILSGAISCMTSGLLYFFLKKGAKSAVLSVLAPVPLLFGYIYLGRDEFGYWAMDLSFGLIACIMGSAFGIFVASLIKNHKS